MKIKNKYSAIFQENTLRFFRHFFIQILIVLFIISAFGFFELGSSMVYRTHPGLYTQDRADRTLQNISALIQLPRGAPTMVVINNASSAKKIQPFLVNADDGDILIVYKSAGEAILYRPSTNKLISVGPVTKTHQSTSVAPVTTVTPTVYATSTNTK